MSGGGGAAVEAGGAARPPGAEGSGAGVAATQGAAAHAVATPAATPTVPGATALAVIEAQGAGAVLLGAGSLFRGFATIVKSPRLWPFAAAPVLIASFALLAGIALGFQAAQWVAEHYMVTWTGWFWGSLAAVGRVLLSIVAIIVSIVLAKAVILPIVAGPFNELLSEAVEVQRTGRTPRNLPFREMLRDALPAAWRGITTALYSLAVLILFAPVLLIPGLGVILYLAPTAYVEAISALDVTFGRKRLSLEEKRAWLRRHRGVALGLGASILVGNLIPLGGIVVVPSAAVGGTLLLVPEVGGGGGERKP